MSGTLVLLGEPGVGKPALLGYALERAGDLQIFRTSAPSPGTRRARAWRLR